MLAKQNTILGAAGLYIGAGEQEKCRPLPRGSTWLRARATLGYREKKNVPR